MTNEEKLSKIADIMNDCDLEAVEKITYIKTVVNKTSVEIYKNPKYTLAEIEQQIFYHLGITIDQMNVKTRDPYIVLARQLAHFKARKSLSGIAWHFGHKDHATVLHSIKTIKNYLDVDKYFHNEHFEF